MPTFETFAARFARCVSLFRDPAAKDEQKAEFRALLGLLQDVAVTLRVSAGRLEVNGTPAGGGGGGGGGVVGDRKSTRLNSSHLVISYAVFCLKKKKTEAAFSIRDAATRDVNGSPTDRNA